MFELVSFTVRSWGAAAVVSIAAVSLVPGIALAQDPEPAAGVAGTARPSDGSPEVVFDAYLTGYSYWDNTPPGSATISNPIVHAKAGGAGTYDDPITMAVGHVIEDGVHTLDYPAGTIFYLPFLRKYAIVEDVCGDGDDPQNRPCHIGYRGHPWLDLYLGGVGISKSDMEDCMNAITAVHEVIQNPAPGHPVEEGEVARSGCNVYDDSDD